MLAVHAVPTMEGVPANSRAIACREGGTVSGQNVLKPRWRFARAARSVPMLTTHPSPRPGAP
eukprot:2339917-Lingulodinium_polyedra.AAC.1